MSPLLSPTASAGRRTIERSISGSATRRSRRTKATAATNTCGEAREQHAVGVPGAAGERQIHERARRREGKEQGTEAIGRAERSARAAAWQQIPAERETDCPGGKIDKEDQPPAANGEQEPAHGGSERQAERLRAALHADAPAEQRRRHRLAISATLLA